MIITGYDGVPEFNSSNWYHYVDSSGRAVSCIAKGECEDNSQYKVANYYSSKNLAKQNARADTLMRLLRRFAAENNDREVDWINKWMPKYYITYDYERKELRVPYVYDVRTFGGVYFSSEKIAQTAIHIFHDELMWYFTEYYDHIGLLTSDGCDLCKSGRLNIFGIEDNLVCISNGVDGFTDKEKFKFCPKCGRKLVSNVE